VQPTGATHTGIVPAPRSEDMQLEFFVKLFAQLDSVEAVWHRRRALELEFE
jgi:hypothetical protein